MNYDFFNNLYKNSLNRLNNMWHSNSYFQSIQMLNTAALLEKKIKNKAKNEVYNKNIKKVKFNEYESHIKNTYKISLGDLPSLSFLIHLGVKLKTNLITGADCEYYIIDNSVCKENTFKVPMIRASSLKGAFRNAYCRIKKINTKKYENEDYKKNYKDKVYENLFGNDRNAPDNDNLKSKLKFYPIFFNKIDIDIINPHDRKTGTGKNPIQMEVIPKGSKGIFQLLYFPFNLAGKRLEDIYINNSKLDTVKRLIEYEFKSLANCIIHIFNTTGIGAKKSLGYGKFNNHLDNNSYVEFNEGYKKIFSELKIIVNNLEDLKNINFGS